jgi:hypothetical protein
MTPQALADELLARARQGDTEQDAHDAFVEGFKPVVPDGDYDAKFIGHETALVFGSPKVFLHFELVEPGDYIGTRLFQAFRVRRLKGKSGKGGRFVAHAGGDLYALLARLLDVKLRGDRISLQSLRSMLFRITTRTVTTNSRQQPIPLPARYSVVTKIRRGE